jgi:hypothetical protein
LTICNRQGANAEQETRKSFAFTTLPAELVKKLLIAFPLGK